MLRMSGFFYLTKNFVTSRKVISIMSMMRMKKPIEWIVCSVLLRYRRAFNFFNQDEKNATAVERRNWQNINDAQVDA